MSFTFHSLNSWQGDQELRRYTLFTSHAGQYRTTCRCSIIHRLFSARHAFLCPYEPQKWFHSTLPPPFLWSLNIESSLSFLGPRGPLGLPSLVRPPARGRKKSGSTVQLYKSTKDHCQPIRYCLVRVWWCLEHVWWCLVVSMYIGRYDLNWLMYMGRYPFQCSVMLLKCWCCCC